MSILEFGFMDIDCLEISRGEHLSLFELSLANQRIFLKNVPSITHFLGE